MVLTKETKRLKDFKERSGWTHLRIADEIGVTRLTVIKWFKGTKPNPLSRKAIKLFLVDYEDEV